MEGRYLKLLEESTPYVALNQEEDAGEELSENFGEEELTEVENFSHADYAEEDLSDDDETVDATFELLAESEETFEQEDAIKTLSLSNEKQADKPQATSSNSNESDQSNEKEIVEEPLNSSADTKPVRRKARKIEQAQFTETFDQAEVIKRVDNNPYLKNVVGPLKKQEKFIRRTIQHALESIDAALTQAHENESRKQVLLNLKATLEEKSREAIKQIEHTFSEYKVYLTILTANLRAKATKELTKEAKKNNSQKKDKEKTTQNTLPTPKKKKRTVKQTILLPIEATVTIGSVSVNKIKKEIGIRKAHHDYVNALIQFKKIAVEIIDAVHAAEVPFLARNITQKTRTTKQKAHEQAQKPIPAQLFSRQQVTSTVQQNKEKALVAAQEREAKRKQEEEKREAAKKEKVVTNPIYRKIIP